MRQMNDTQKLQEAVRIMQGAGISLSEAGKRIREALIEASKSINELKESHRISQLPKPQSKFHS